MSRYTGSQYKGASRDAKRELRAQAESRNLDAKAGSKGCGHVHGVGVGCYGREGIDLTREVSA